jgi:hypothetical protein
MTSETSIDEEELYKLIASSYEGKEDQLIPDILASLFQKQGQTIKPGDPISTGGTRG